MDAAEKINRMTKEVDDAKEVVAEAKGEMRNILSNLKEISGVASVTKSKTVLKKLEDEVDKLSARLETILKKLEVDYEWS